MQIALFFVLFACLGAKASALDKKESIRAQVRDMRGTRYCEILVSNSAKGIMSVFDLTAYNTLMFGCDQDQWNNLTERTVQDQFNSVLVKLNGPRYWVMDTVTASSKLINEEITFIGGLKMMVVGIVEASLYDIFCKIVFGKITDYVERHVNRHTIYVFHKDSTVYVMTSPVGKTYIMQSFSAQYAPLTLDSLDNLGAMLHPPAGWSYKAINLTEELHIPAPNSIGTLINDEFFNSYSLFDPALLEGNVAVSAHTDGKRISPCTLTNCMIP